MAPVLSPIPSADFSGTHGKRGDSIFVTLPRLDHYLLYITWDERCLFYRLLVLREIVNDVLLEIK